MNSETEFNSSFRSRLGELVGEQKPFEWAKKVGIPSATWNRAWNEGAIPKAQHLTRIAEHAGVTLDWLISGRGPRHRTVEPSQEMERGEDITPRTATSIDKELMGRIVDGIVRTYKDIGVYLPPIDLGRMAQEMADQLAETYEDPDDRPVGLKALLRRLRDDLAAAPAVTDNQTKHRA